MVIYKYRIKKRSTKVDLFLFPQGQNKKVKGYLIECIQKLNHNTQQPKKSN